VGGNTLKSGQVFHVREEFANERQDHRSFILAVKQDGNSGVEMRLIENGVSIQYGIESRVYNFATICDEVSTTYMWHQFCST
jgi:hypothetical protein